MSDTTPVLDPTAVTRPVTPVVPPVTVIPPAVIVPPVVPPPVVVVTPLVPPAGPTAFELGNNICPGDDAANAALATTLAILNTTTPVTDAAIAVAQTAFYNILIKFLVNKDEATASAFLKNILEYIAYNVDNHFTSKLKFRGFDKLSGLNTTQQKEFTILLYVLVDVAVSTTRVSNSRAMAWESIRGEFVPAHADILLDRLKKFLNVN